MDGGHEGDFVDHGNGEWSGGPGAGEHAGFEMRKLYDVQLVEPFATGSARPSRLGYQTIAWCESLDLIAVVSGCGGVSVFHADAPGENAWLTSSKKAAARHVAWRPATKQLGPLLLVADTGGRLTFWASRNYRVNVWEEVGQETVKPSVMAVGWTRDASMVTAVLSHGMICVWRVIELPSGQLDIRALEPSDGPDNRYGRVLSGAVRCASIAPGGVSEEHAALITVMENTPSHVDVWQILPSRDASNNGEITRFVKRCRGSAALTNDTCIASLAYPRNGALFSWGESGVVERWILAKEKGTSDDDSVGRWQNYGRFVPHQPPGCRSKTTSVAISIDGTRVVTADSKSGIRVQDGRALGSDAGYAGVPLDSGRLPHWGLCFSPSGLCVVALTGDGIVQMWAVTSPEPKPSDLATQLIERTTDDGRRGCWDVFALLVKQGKDHAAAVARALTKFEQVKKTDTLRLAVLSAVDVNTAAVAAARKLLEAAIVAIEVSATPVVTSKLNAYQMDTRDLFMNSDNILQCINGAAVSAQSTPPKLAQLSAAPLADWIILLCMVWLRRAARAVKRLGGEQEGSVWTPIVQADGGIRDDQTNVLKDPSLTKSLRGASVAAAVLLHLDELYGDQDLNPRYHRLKKEETADVVAALWDASLPMEQEQGIEVNYANVGYALSKHTVAAMALGNSKLLIDNAEKALGIRGSAHNAGFTLACAREDRINGTDMSGKVSEWCPYDIVTGRPLSPWVPLRRCVVSGLLAAEMTKTVPRDESDYPTLVPWVQRWAHESPFGGLWFRLPSLDLDRFELMKAVPLDQQNATAHTLPRAGSMPDQSFSSQSALTERTSTMIRNPRRPRGGETSMRSVQRDQQDPANDFESQASADLSMQRAAKAPKKGKKKTPAASSTMHSAEEEQQPIAEESKQNLRMMNPNAKKTQPPQQQPQPPQPPQPQPPQPPQPQPQAQPPQPPQLQPQAQPQEQHAFDWGPQIHQQRPQQMGGAPVQRGRMRMQQPPQRPSDAQWQQGPRHGEAQWQGQTQGEAQWHGPGQGQLAGQVQTQGLSQNSMTTGPPRPRQRAAPQQQSEVMMQQNRIWKGRLNVTGKNRVSSILCVAQLKNFGAQQAWQGQALTSAEGWPPVLECDSSRLKYFDQLKHELYSPSAQWYVEFVPIDDPDQPTGSNLNGIIKFLSEQQYTFEILCESSPRQGKLILFGSNPGRSDDDPNSDKKSDYVLLGVFVPRG